MKAFLMFEDRDFRVDAGLLESLERRRRREQPDRDQPVGEQDLADQRWKLATQDCTA